LEPQRELMAALAHEVHADDDAARRAWAGAKADPVGVDVEDLAPTVHVDAHRVHVIEGILALRTQQRMRFLEVPTVEKTAHVQFWHQVLLRLRRRTPRRRQAGG
jgi:hypothetical protein